MLALIQQQFLAALFNQQQTPEILSSISQQGSRTALDQFNCYRDSVVSGITEALAISYPVVKKLVGEQFFNHLCYLYLVQHPSTSPDLNDYGEQFSNFIDTLSNTQSVPYLSDVAKLEWAWQKIINGSNSQTNNLQQLSNLTERQSENIHFQLAAHSTLIHSPYPIHEIWQMNQLDTQQTDSSNIININNNDVNLLLWRNNFDMNITPIELKHWVFLSLINRDIAFSEVCVEYSQLYSQHDITTLLTHSIQSGWITSFTI